MILIADSGSSKTDWVVINEKDHHLYHSAGLNPYFLPWNEIHAEVRRVFDGEFDFNKVDQVFFFGSGCTDDDQINKVKLALVKCFINAQIEINSDIQGAIQATVHNESGIVSILGTGTNCCYYDGKNISQKVIALGYLLGDEGSGTALGRKLIQTFAYKSMPEEIESAFIQHYQITIEQIKREVYQLPKPNTYIASYAPFLKKHIDHPFINDLVKSSFEELYDKQLSQLKVDNAIPMHFVGSIAFQFQNVLKAVLESRNRVVGRIVEKPIDGLVANVNYLTEK